jgi:hypothetical protein
MSRTVGLPEDFPRLEKPMYTEKSFLLRIAAMLAPKMKWLFNIGCDHCAVSELSVQ